MDSQASSSTKTLATKIHHTLDYRAKTQAVPRYDLSDVYPQTGNRTLQLSDTKTNILEFELPPRCINLARSKLEFDLEADYQVTTETKDGGAAVVPQVPKISVKTDAISFIDRIEVFTRSGVRLMDLDRQQLWSKISNTYFQDANEYPVSHSVGDAVFEQKHAQPWLSKREDDDAATGVVGVKSVSKKGLKAFTTRVLDEVKLVADGSQSNKSLGGWSLDLGQFRDSILAVDKTLFFGGQVLNIKLHISGYSDFLHAQVGDTAVNAASETVPLIGDENISSTGDGKIKCTKVQMKNITIRSAFESNPVIIAQIKQKVMSKSGLSLFVPYTYFIEQSNVEPKGRQSMITRLNRGYGIRLHRLVTTVTPNHINEAVKLKQQLSKSETCQLWDLNDANQVKAQSKIKDYYTSLNNRRLQERDVVINDGSKYALDSYNYTKSSLKGTLISTPAAHLENWCHVDSFDGYDATAKDHINVVTGLPLSDDMQYTFHANLNALSSKVTFTTFAICQRSLLLKADSITIV